MASYQWLILYLVEETDKRMNEVMQSGLDKFTARNESQVYRASVLCRAYGEYTALRYYWARAEKGEFKKRFFSILFFFSVCYFLFEMSI